MIMYHKLGRIAIKSVVYAIFLWEYMIKSLYKYQKEMVGYEDCCIKRTFRIWLQ